MPQAVPTLAAGDLESRGGLVVLGDAVRTDGLSEGRPRRGVLELLDAGKQLIPTLGTHVNA